MLNVLIAGAGFMGKTHANVYKDIGVNIVALLETNDDSAAEFAKEYGCATYKTLSEALKSEKIDIVDICLPTFLHENVAVEALQAGRHVLLEKPIALTFDSAGRIVDAAKASAGMFMVAQVLRFWPEYVKIKELKDAGELGENITVYANRLAQTPTWSPWFTQLDKSGGGLFDLMMHDVDYINHLFGLPKTVYAVGRKSDYGAWNNVIASFTYADGTNAVVEMQYEMTSGYPFSMNLRAMGSQGTVDFKFSAGFNLEDRESAINSFMFYSDNNDPVSLEKENIDAYEKELRYFVDCVKGGTHPSIMTPDSIMITMRMIDAVKRSLETGEKVIL